MYRFDAPRGTYGVIYLAEEPQGALIETLGRDFSQRVLLAASLAQRHIALVETGRPLRVVDLTGGGLNAIGADASLGSGRESYRVTQAWSEAFFRHPERPDGILYRCRHDPSQRAVALFARSRRVLRARDHGPLLGGSATVSLVVLEAMVEYGYAIDAAGSSMLGS